MQMLATYIRKLENKLDITSVELAESREQTIKAKDELEHTKVKLTTAEATILEERNKNSVQESTIAKLQATEKFLQEKVTSLQGQLDTANSTIQNLLCKIH